MVTRQRWPVPQQVRDVGRVDDAARVDHQHATSPVGQRVGEYTAAEARADDDDVLVRPSEVPGMQPFLLPDALLGAEIVVAEQRPRRCSQETIKHASALRPEPRS